MLLNLLWAILESSSKVEFYICLSALLLAYWDLFVGWSYAIGFLLCPQSLPYRSNGLLRHGGDTGILRY